MSNGLYTEPFVSVFQKHLLDQGHRCVAYSDIDEVLVAPGGLRAFFASFAASDRLTVRPTGYECVHVTTPDEFKQGSAVEPAINWTQPLLAQVRGFHGSPRCYYGISKDTCTH